MSSVYALLLAVQGIHKEYGLTRIQKGSIQIFTDTAVKRHFTDGRYLDQQFRMKTHLQNDYDILLAARDLYFRLNQPLKFLNKREDDQYREEEDEQIEEIDSDNAKPPQHSSSDLLDCVNDMAIEKFKENVPTPPHKHMATERISFHMAG